MIKKHVASSATGQTKILSQKLPCRPPNHAYGTPYPCEHMRKNSIARRIGCPSLPDCARAERTVARAAGREACAVAAARSARGARKDRTRTTQRRKSWALLVQRPPTWDANSKSCCRPARASSGYWTRCRLVRLGLRDIAPVASVYHTDFQGAVLLSMLERLQCAVNYSTVVYKVLAFRPAH